MVIHVKYAKTVDIDPVIVKIAFLTHNDLYGNWISFAPSLYILLLINLLNFNPKITPNIAFKIGITTTAADNENKAASLEIGNSQNANDWEWNDGKSNGCQVAMHTSELLLNIKKDTAAIPTGTMDKKRNILKLVVDNCKYDPLKDDSNRNNI